MPGRLFWHPARPGRDLLADLLVPVGGALALMIALGALVVHRAQRAITASAGAARALAQMRDLFYDAIDSLSEGFVLFDADGRLVMCNEHYRKAYPLIADLLVPGTSFETVLRAAATRADLPEARGNLDAWVKTRLERHAHHDAPVDGRLSDGRWYRISEHPTRSGGIVKVLMDITELQRHTEEIANTSTLLRTVIDTIEQGISVFAADGTLLAWNAHFPELLAYPEGLAQAGRPLAAFEAFDRARGAVRAAILLGPPLLDDPDAVERRRVSAHELPDGRVIEVCETPMPGGGVVATYTEITGRLRFEEVLIEEVLTKLAQAVSGASGDAFFESLVASLSRALEVEVALIGALAADGTITTLAVSADGRIVEDLEYRPEGGPFAGIPEHRLCLYRRDAGRRFPGDPLFARWAVESCLGKPLLGSDGRVLGIIAVASRRPLDRVDTAEALLDIFAARAAAEFERLQTETALRESEQRYRELVEHAPYGIVIADGPRIVFANTAAGRVFGLADAGLLVGSSLTERVGAGADAALPAALDAAAEAGAAADRAGGEPIGARIRTAEGEERDLEIGVCPFVAEGRPLALVVLSDVTNRRRAELALQHAQKMQAVGQLAGGVAHEFNNMLTAIGGFARMAARAPDQLARVTMCLGEIVKASDRAASLTAQLLNFSRQGASRAVPVVVGDLVRDLKTFLRPVLGETIGVTLEIADPPVTVLADPAQLNQAIVNLAINGRDAIPGGGELLIRVAGCTPDRDFAERHPGLTAARYAAITVRDQGCGISEAIIDRIFEPFFTTKEPGKGTGLGLSMVYTLATASGGTVEVRSALGAGSTFTLYLPAAAEAAPAEAAEMPAAPGPRRATVLLVEDEDQVRTLLGLTLEEHGLDVLTAADGAAALELFRRHGAALRLLITDLVMPALGGIEVARRLRRERPELPVIFISGYASGGPDGEGGPAGAVGPGQMLLHKPIAPAALLAAVDAALAPLPALRRSGDPGEAPKDLDETP